MRASRRWLWLTTARRNFQSLKSVLSNTFCPTLQKRVLCSYPKLLDSNHVEAAHAKDKDYMTGTQNARNYVNSEIQNLGRSSYQEPNLVSDENEIDAGVDGDIDKTSISPQISKHVQNICSLLDNRGWDTETEASLDEKFASDLSHSVVSKVILKQRRMQVAASFFKWANKKIGFDSYSCHAYLMKLGEAKQFDKMWELLNEMKSHDCEITGTTFCIFIKAYGSARMLAMAVDVFKRVYDYKVQPDIHLYTTLISVFFLLNQLEEARLCYRNMLKGGLQLDVSAYNTLIRGFGMSSCLKDAESCFDIMAKEGHTPDISSYNGLIESFCQVNAMRSAMATFSAIQEKGLKPNVSTFNIIIKAYCKTRRFEDAVNVFASMKKLCVPNQSTFNILLQGLLLGEDISKAVDFFRLMESEGWVDARSYIYLSNGLRQTKQTDEMLDLLKSLFTKHGYGNAEVCNALIHNLLALNRLHEAEEVFIGMVNSSCIPSITSYAIMIKSYCRLEKIEKAIELIAELKKAGYKPNSFCYTPIVGAMLRRNKISDAMECFEEMLVNGVEVDAVVCDSLLRALSKQGLIEDALKICKMVVENRFTIGILTLFDLMKCFSKDNRVEEANDLFQTMYKNDCLPKSKAILQAMGVMNLMTPTCNEVT